jgi:hypothetical protein
MRATGIGTGAVARMARSYVEQATGYVRLKLTRLRKTYGDSDRNLC